MLTDDYLARVRMLLIEQGISFRQSDRLIEELRDHLALKIAELQAQGNSLADSERLAEDLIGTPEAISKKASADLQGSWLLRLAWLPCGAGLFFASFLIMFAVVFLGWYFAGGIEYDNGSAPRVSIPIIQVEVVLFNWLPLLLGMAGLAALIRFSSIGWKSIFVAAIALGFAVSAESIRFNIGAIAESTKLCFLEMDDSFILQWLGLGFGRFPEHEPILLTIVRLLAPLGMCLLARFAIFRSGSNPLPKSDTQ